MTFEHAARGAADPERLAAEMSVTVDEAADMCPASYQWAQAVQRLGTSFADAAAAFEKVRAALADTHTAARWVALAAAFTVALARSEDPMPAVTSCLSAALRPPELRHPPSWVIPHPKVGQPLRDAQALAGEIERARTAPGLRDLLRERVWGPEYGAWR